MIDGTFLLIGCGLGITAGIVFILRVLFRWDLTAIFLVSVPATLILAPAAMFAVQELLPKFGGTYAIGFMLGAVAIIVLGCVAINNLSDGIFSQVNDARRKGRTK